MFKDFFLFFHDIDGLKDYADGCGDMRGECFQHAVAFTFALELGGLCDMTVCQKHCVGLVFQGHQILDHEVSAFDDAPQGLGLGGA